MKKICSYSGIALIIDIVSKLIISNTMLLNSSITVIDNFFSLTYAHNYGAAWSSFLGKRYFLVIVSIIIISGILIYLKKKNNYSKLETIAYSFLLGGAIGNLFDRIIYGYVIDFLDFYLFGYDYPIFNIADSLVVVGIVILIIDTFRKERNNDNKCK